MRSIRNKTDSGLHAGSGSLEKNLATAGTAEASKQFQDSDILDDLIAADNVEEDESNLGLSKLFWGEPQDKVWMREKG